VGHARDPAPSDRQRFRPEQKFQYNDATKVTGDRAGVAGLATLSGKQVVVHFNSQGANRIATEIEVQADKGEK
jgi:hypothetical protein